MIKGTDPTGRAWQVGDLSRKVGKTLMSQGTNIQTLIHEGMAVIDEPHCPEDEGLVTRAIAALSKFVEVQEARRNKTITFSDRGNDGKFMMFYNHKKTDDMEQGPDGKFRHVQYSAAKNTSPVVNIHYAPRLVNVVAELPKDTSTFVVMYLKGLAELFACPTDNIFNWHMMLLNYTAGGGFSSHSDGIKAFNNQAGIVVLLSLAKIANQPKYFDMIPVSVLSRDSPIRITTTGSQAILMSGLPRVDEPHAVPFGNTTEGCTLAIKMPFVDSDSPYIRMLTSQLSGVKVQMFDTKLAVEAGKGTPVALKADAPEFTFPALKADAPEFTFPALKAEAKEFVPSF